MAKLQCTQNQRVVNSLLTSTSIPLSILCLTTNYSPNLKATSLIMKSVMLVHTVPIMKISLLLQM